MLDFLCSLWNVKDDYYSFNMDIWHLKHTLQYNVNCPQQVTLWQHLNMEFISDHNICCAHHEREFVSLSHMKMHLSKTNVLIH
jgi:hypothetical protein